MPTSRHPDTTPTTRLFLFSPPSANLHHVFFHRCPLRPLQPAPAIEKPHIPRSHPPPRPSHHLPNSPSWSSLPLARPSWSTAGPGIRGLPGWCVHAGRPSRVLSTADASATSSSSVRPDGDRTGLGSGFPSALAHFLPASTASSLSAAAAAASTYCRLGARISLPNHAARLSDFRPFSPSLSAASALWRLRPWCIPEHLFSAAAIPRDDNAGAGKREGACRGIRRRGV